MNSNHFLSNTPALGSTTHTTPMDYLKQLLTSQVAWITSYLGVADGVLLFFLGTWLANCGLWISAFLDLLLDTICITAAFTEGNHSYLWLTAWLNSNAAYNATARNVKVVCDSMAPLRPDPRTNTVPSDRNWMQACYLPALSSYVRLWYNWYPMTLVRREQSNHIGMGNVTTQSVVTIRIYGAWSNLVLTDFLNDIQKAYLESQKQNVTIYHMQGGMWIPTQSFSRRDPTSLVLVPGQWEALLADALDFLSSQEWYHQRGIQYRRGYLLYGPPGSGKTSLIRTLAGALGLSMYPIILSQAGMDDSALAALVNALPKHCLAIMEDIDAAFTSGVSREDRSSEPNPSDTKGKGITLSGLLNALDGLSSHEGRIFIATTNKLGALDPALIRPGRMDIHLKLGNASKDQARRLFKKIYSQKGNIAPTLPDDPSGSVESDSKAHSQLPSDGKTAAAASFPQVVPGEDKTSDDVMITGIVHTAKARKLDQYQLNMLAMKFSEAIPEGEFSMSSLQGYLLQYKVHPENATDNITTWVQRELTQRNITSKAEASLPTSSLTPSATGIFAEDSSGVIQPETNANDGKATGSPTPPWTPFDRTATALPQNWEPKEE